VHLHNIAGTKTIPKKKRGISLCDEVCLGEKHIHQKIHMEMIILGCWNIWNEINQKIFNNERASIQNWKRLLKEDIPLVIHREK
jgi:hypothetical protein